MYSSGEGATLGTDKTIYSGMRPRCPANPELTRETSEQTNIGIDLRLFNSALTITADMPIPQSTIDNTKGKIQ